jgi:thiosulfate reductase cytochrome b subunit
MAGSAYFAQSAIRTAAIAVPVRHSMLVRITHWVHTISFFGLLVSGIAILLAHPRLYWGEVGNVDTPSIIDLPLPFVLTGQTGWGRSLHFLSAWVCVIDGLLYVASGFVTRRFLRNPPEYRVSQRTVYLGVVFVLLPLMIWTGFAMSPAITSAFPILVTSLGGQQSARTIHCFVTGMLVLFLMVHVVMVLVTRRVTGMITGRERV